MSVELQELSGPSTCVLAEPADHVLLEDLRGGDRDAATILYRRYAKRLRQLIRSKCSPAGT